MSKSGQISGIKMPMFVKGTKKANLYQIKLHVYAGNNKLKDKM